MRSYFDVPIAKFMFFSLQCLIVFGVLASPQKLYAQSAPACSESGFEVISGLGDGVDSLDRHTVELRVTNAESVRSHGQLRVELFEHHPPGSANSQSSHQSVASVNNNDLLTFILPRPISNEPESTLTYRYIYVYGYSIWTLGANNPVVCYVGLIPAQIAPQAPGETPPPGSPQGPPNAPTSPPQGLDPASCGWVVPSETGRSCRTASAENPFFTDCQDTNGNPACCISNHCPTSQPPDEPVVYSCGQQWSPFQEPSSSCVCPDSPNNPINVYGRKCCGWENDNACVASAPQFGGGSGGDGGGGGGGGFSDGDEADETTPPSIFDTGLTSTHFKNLNPLERSTVGARLSSPGGIIGRVMQFAFPLAGLILFAMIVWGGFEMLTGAASSKGMDAGKQRVTNAIIGFIILFSSYWIIQIVQTIFGIAIL